MPPTPVGHPSLCFNYTRGGSSEVLDQNAVAGFLGSRVEPKCCLLLESKQSKPVLSVKDSLLASIDSVCARRGWVSTLFQCNVASIAAPCSRVLPYG